MWLSELASRGGVSVATAKYYLREGLVPPGEAVGATRARYDQSHVDRLRLVRALVDVAGLSLDQVRDVLAAMAAERSPAAAIGAAHYRLSPPPPTEPSAAALDRVRALVADRGWQVDDDSPHLVAVASALDAMEAAGQPLADTGLETYAASAGEVAKVDLEAMVASAGPAGEDAATYAVLGTLLTEPVLVGLRRMAQEHQARARLG
ncbi:MerR family transcriptional regulator [Knoellia koreensis]|uniref:MerR family transcriptional regulator n=1 Tax=Knoellia koreensis TaxID=2730921 RepID=A0A849HDB0_9MICO|nr:MerR family transcriptional regulator [Knoellia sp. DB2414S]NNM44633.1 MerR family transcriptional regulator [Knoellia sp. DB2414S]